MIHRRLGYALLGLLAVGSTGRADDPPAALPPGLVPITVRAGQFERRHSLVQFKVPADRFAPAVVARLRERVGGLNMIDPGESGVSAGAKPSIAEARIEPDGSVRIAWFLPRAIPSGGEAHFLIDGTAAPLAEPTPWSGTATPHGAVIVSHRGAREQEVFQYNAGPTAQARAPGNASLIRDGYIHPAYAPSGALVTGDFSAYHPHHRGFFLAYVHTKWGDLEPDFWNFQNGSGRISADGFDPPTYGPVTYRFEARHRWEAIRKTPGGAEADVALRERWQVALYDVPGSPYWLLDLTSTQQAEGHPLDLIPYRYGGMAYRSAEPSVLGPLDVVTAEGRHRFDGDQKPTRWADLTGPIADGSPNYAGAMIADHPSNPHFPNVVRIHPITLPFFSFVPAHDQPLTIPTDRPTVFRYRILIHDGRPDPALNDRIAADFVDPPAVTVD